MASASKPLLDTLDPDSENHLFQRLWLMETRAPGETVTLSPRSRDHEGPVIAVSPVFFWAKPSRYTPLTALEARQERTCRQTDVEMILDRYSQVDVECYSGYRGEEEPRRFTRGGVALHIAEILDRWLDPNHRYFKVLASDGVYILRHDTNSGMWEVTVYLSGRDG